MGTIRNRALAWLSSALVALVVVACHGGSGSGPAVEELWLTASSTSLPLGRTAAFVAKVRYTDGSLADVSNEVLWTRSVGAGVTVTVSGQVTAQAMGSFVVSARLASADMEASLQAVVTAAELDCIEVTPPVPQIALGTTQQFVATGIYSDNSNQDLTSSVTWSCDALAVASVDTVGLASSATVGQATISATDPTTGIASSASLQVTSAVLTAIEVSPTTPSIALGTTQAFVAMGRFSDNTLQDLTDAVAWSSDNTPVATVSNAPGTEGLATSVSTGTTNITALHVATALSDTVALTVTPAVLVSLAVTPVTPSIALGTTQQFVATGTFSDSTLQDLTTSVTWISSDLGVATVSNATSSEGLATSIATGTTTITATEGGSGIDDGVTLTVTPVVLVSVAVTPTTPSIALGLTQQFVATGTYSDTSQQDITDAVTWSSTATGVATVSNAGGSEGLATSLSVGATTISALHPGSGLNDATTLTVTAAVLVSVAVTPATPSIALGTTQQFVATGTYSDASFVDLTTSVTWSSATPATATISNAGGTEGLATSVAAGTSMITALDAGSGLNDAVTLTVTAAVLVSIDVTPGTTATGIGLVEAFVATGTYSDTSQQDLTDSVTWSSSAPAVASVSNAGGSEGEATGLSLGSTTITALDAGTGVNDSASLTVTAAGIAVRGSSSASSASGTTLSLTTPALTLVGDVLIAAIAVRPQGASITPPAGWTLVRRSDSTGGASNSLAIYTRLAVVAEPATHDFVLSTSTGSAGGLVALREVDGASPVDVDDGTATANGLTHTAPDVTTTVANCMLVTAHAFASAETWTEPAGMTELVDISSIAAPAATGISLSVNVELRVAAGATGTRSAVASGNSDVGNAITVALAPE